MKFRQLLTAPNQLTLLRMLFLPFIVMNLVDDDNRIALGLFVLAALITTYSVGVMLLFVMVELGATGSRHRSSSAARDLGLGLLQPPA